jgi:Protein of unknown function (DUF2628)
LKTFTVHEPPEPDADRVDRASELLFVNDGFSWLTAICPRLGFAAGRMWLPLLAYLGFAGAAAWIMSTLGFSPEVLSLMFIAVNIYLGFEHSALERWMLDNAGWQMLGSVTGKTLDECERRFFETWLPSQPMISTTYSRPKSSEIIPPRRVPWSPLSRKA